MVVALTSEYVDSLRYYLHKKLHITLPIDNYICNTLLTTLHLNSIWVLSVGELLLIVVITMMLVGQFLLFYLDHGWQLLPLSFYTTQERAARSLGQMANICMALLIMPVARNNIWTVVFGVSWESMLNYHKYLGGLFVCIITMHMFTFWSVYQQQGSFPHDILAVPTTFHADNFTIPLIMVTFLCIICVMIPCANYAVRRWNYDVFYMVHHFFMVIFFAMLWHATMAWYFIIGSVILWVCDHIIRMSNCIDNHVHVVNITTNGSSDITQLVYEVYNPFSDMWNSCIQAAHSIGLVSESTAAAHRNVTNDMNIAGRGGRGGGFNNKNTPGTFNVSSYHPMHHEVGQYCFINIPSISTSEWHPFTISSAPCYDKYTTHHIRNMSDTEWTGKLYALARDYDNGGSGSGSGSGGGVDGIVKGEMDGDGGRDGKSIVELSVRKSELHPTVNATSTANGTNTGNNSSSNNNSNVNNKNTSISNTPTYTNHNTNLLMHVDGPYGVPIQLSKYTHIVLIAGGIGITPMIAYYRYLYHAIQDGLYSHIHTIQLVWSMRNEDDARLFVDTVSVVCAV